MHLYLHHASSVLMMPSHLLHDDAGVSPALGRELREYVLKTERRLARSLHVVTGGAGSLADAPGPEPTEYGAPQGQASGARRRQCPVVVRCNGGSDGMPARDIRTLLALPWNIQVRS